MNNRKSSPIVLWIVPFGSLCSILGKDVLLGTSAAHLTLKAMLVLGSELIPTVGKLAIEQLYI